MRRPTLVELDERCQKLGHRRLGNWMARRVTRPAALRVTWIVSPWPISAHMVTVGAWMMAMLGAMAFAAGTPGGWVCGTVLLQVWYLLDHVDGQLARLRRTESLDGVALDYLMHHCVHLLVPLGVGWGLVASDHTPAWMLAGVMWGVSVLMLGLLDDVRYKAFIQRLKRVEGELRVVGGGGGRPASAASWPRTAGGVVARVMRKACEMHVTMNALTLLAMLAWSAGDERMLMGRLYLLAVAPISAAVFLVSLFRVLRYQAAENEFAVWFCPPADSELVRAGHWWRVTPVPTAMPGETVDRLGESRG